MCAPSCYFLLCGRITQGPGFPTKTKLSGSWAGVRLLLNWQNFAGEGDDMWQPGSWLATRMTRLRRIIPPFLLSFRYHKDLMTGPPSHVVSACGQTLVIASWHCWHYASKCDHRGSLRVTNGHNTGPHPIRGLVTGLISHLSSHRRNLTSWTGAGVLRMPSWDNANHMEIAMERWRLLKLFRMSNYYHWNNRFNVSVSGEFQTMWNQFESLLPSIHPS